MKNSVLLTEEEAQNLAQKALQTEQNNVDLEIILKDFPQLKKATLQKGKVSDSIIFRTEKENYRILVRSNRISTHDKSRGIIPFKDQILSTNHNFMRKLVSPYMKHAQLDVIGLGDNSVVSLALNGERFPLELVLRNYMAKSTTGTSLYQHWLKDPIGKFCGINLGYYKLEPNGKLPYTWVTPSTKEANDRSVPPEELFSSRYPGSRLDPSYWDFIRNQALVVFGVVSNYLRTKGIILVDCKTEHALFEDIVLAIDEMYTMDSCRFWLMKADGTPELDENGEPKSFSKEFARQFAKGNAEFTNKEKVLIATRYILGIQHLTGQAFVPDLRPWEERVRDGIARCLAQIDNHEL